ncbi:hypothetical protein [Anaerospora hongkongensis]
MSKRGSPYLRRAIWLAAQRAAFCDLSNPNNSQRQASF